MPFLENVTRGRGIPRERLEEVGEHYFRLGGRSPINDLNRVLLDAIRADLRDHGIDIPVYWGNRNWDPYLADTMRRMRSDGVTRGGVFRHERLLVLLLVPAVPRGSRRGRRRQREDGPRLDRLRSYYNHPGFLEPVVDAVAEAVTDRRRMRAWSSSRTRSPRR